MSLPIGVDQGAQQQAAGIDGFPQWPYVAQPTPSFGSLTTSQNGSAVVEKQSNRAKASAKRGRRPKKEATEEATPTRAAKKQKLPPQATETDAPSEDGQFTVLGKWMAELVKEKTLKLEIEIEDLKAKEQKNEEDLQNAMKKRKAREEKILEDGFKIKSLENAKESLYTVFMTLGGLMHCMMDTMETAWNNKMESLDQKTEEIEGNVGLLREVLTKQKQDHKDGILEVERRAQLSIDSSQKIVVKLQENLRSTLDEKEKNAKEYEFALQAQHWIMEEKEEGWSMRNHCLELEKAEMKATNSELMEKNHREESKSSFYEQEYKKAMKTVAEVQKMVSKDLNVKVKRLQDSMIDWANQVSMKDAEILKLKTERKNKIDT